MDVGVSMRTGDGDSLSAARFQIGRDCEFEAGTKGTCSSSSFSVRTVVAKNTMSAIVKHAGDIGEAASDVIGCTTLSHCKLWRAMHHSSLS